MSASVLMRSEAEEGTIFEGEDLHQAAQPVRDVLLDELQHPEFFDFNITWTPSAESDEMFIKYTSKDISVAVPLDLSKEIKIKIKYDTYHSQEVVSVSPEEMPAFCEFHRNKVMGNIEDMTSASEAFERHKRNAVRNRKSELSTEFGKVDNRLSRLSHMSKGLGVGSFLVGIMTFLTGSSLFLALPFMLFGVYGIFFDNALEKIKSWQED